MVIVRLQFEGFHHYPQAPAEVAFLKYPHRHMFHIRAEIEVTHTDRDLEIIMVKRRLHNYLTETNFGRGSCEEIANNLQEFLKVEYPLPDSYTRNRVVHVEVLEDGENGAKAIDPLMYTLMRFAEEDNYHLHGEGTERKFKKVGLSTAPESICFNSYNEKIPGSSDTTYIAKIMEDVVGLDKQFDLDEDMELNTSNVLFMANAIAGEVGELCNYVKKMVRDGESEALWKDLDFEVVDVFIYLAKFIALTKMDFDNAWDEKHAELEGRYKAGKKHLSYNQRTLHREE